MEGIGGKADGSLSRTLGLVTMHGDDQDFLELLGGELDGLSTWRCFRRNGRTLVIFPSGGCGARAAGQLYSPQRFLAKVAARVAFGLPGVWRLLPSFSWAIKESSPLGQWTGSLGMMLDAVLLGNPSHEGRRALAIGEGQVVKIGVSGEAARLVQHEGDFLAQKSDETQAFPTLVQQHAGDGWAAFVMPFYQDCDLSDEGVIEIVERWLGGEKVAIVNLAGWEKIENLDDPKLRWIVEGCADLKLSPSLMHGDLAPWNVRQDERGLPVLIDWEEARQQAVPCWDVVHFVFQKLVLIERRAPRVVFKEMLSFLSSTKMDQLMVKSGWKGFERLLFASYLVAMATEDDHAHSILTLILESLD